MEMDNFTPYDLEEGRSAIDVSWDTTDNRFLGVLTEYSRGKPSAEEEDLLIWKGMKLFTLFFTSQSGIKLQDEYNFEKHQEALFGIKIPHILIIARNSSSSSKE